eukprot:569645-Prorocentrum_minimum.AAC.4
MEVAHSGRLRFGGRERGCVNAPCSHVQGWRGAADMTCGRDGGGSHPARRPRRPRLVRRPARTRPRRAAPESALVLSRSPAGRQPGGAGGGSHVQRFERQEMLTGWGAGRGRGSTSPREKSRECVE